MKMFTRIVAAVLLAMMLLSLIPVGALAAEAEVPKLPGAEIADMAPPAASVNDVAQPNARSIVGFEIYNRNELPELVWNPYYYDQSDLVTGTGSSLFSRIRFLVTYSDGSQEIVQLRQEVNGEYIQRDYYLNGPGTDNNYIVFTLGGKSVTYYTSYVDSPVSYIEVTHAPDPLIVGRDIVATKYGYDVGINLNIWDACFDGLSFKIHYKDGTTAHLRHSDLTWPDNPSGDKWSSFPYYENYNVEIQAYIEYQTDGFAYWTGNWYEEGRDTYTMNLYYMGAMTTFDVQVQEGPVAKVITQPSDVTAAISTYGRFTAGITGPGLRYQWQYRTNANDSWKNFTENDSAKTPVLDVQALPERDGWQFRLAATDSNGKSAWTEPATLTIFCPSKAPNESGDDYIYEISDLYIGSDGIYRTPDGYKVYIGVNNAADGGISGWLGGNTLYDYVEAHGWDYFDLTYWEDLKALMDADGYVPLTEDTLLYLTAVTTWNGAWGEAGGECIPYYLFFDYDRNATSQPDGWAQENGSWVYYKNGSKVTGWLNDGGYWYYFNANGIMQTGWVSVGGKWYYMNKSGVMMANCWQKVGNYWYYMNKDGSMATGWTKVGSNWYFMNKNGVMMTGWVKDGNYWYFMSSGGAMQTGWVAAGGKWYYMNKSGVMLTNSWVKVGNYWYYMSASGAMVTGTQVIGGKTYYFNDKGVWIP